MTENASSLAAAAASVMQALEPLEPEARERVLQSAAALYGFRLSGTSTPRRAVHDSADGDADEDGADESKTGKRLSLVEFLNGKQPVTNAQRIAAFAYYREHVEAKGSTFAKADLRGYFPLAKLPKPGTYNRDWNSAVSEGWIHDEGSASYLTQGGEDKVRAGFGGKGKPRGSTGGKKGRRAPKTGEE